MFWLAPYKARCHYIAARTLFSIPTSAEAMISKNGHRPSKVHHEKMVGWFLVNSSIDEILTQMPGNFYPQNTKSVSTQNTEGSKKKCHKCEKTGQKPSRGTSERSQEPSSPPPPPLNKKERKIILKNAIILPTKLFSMSVNRVLVHTPQSPHPPPPSTTAPYQIGRASPPLGSRHLSHKK